MHAVVLKEFGGIENLADMEWSEPEPKTGEVKIRSRMVSVNPTDYKARRGGNQGTVPLVMGRDVAGVVEAVGEGVSRFAAGDEVMAYLPRFGDSGGEGYADFVCVLEDFVMKKPANLSFEQAAAVPLVSLTAYELVVLKAKVQPGEAVFAAGASGGVGTMAVQMICHLGGEPLVVTAGSDKSAAYLRGLGVAPEKILRYAGLSLEEMYEQALVLNGGRLYPAVFDMVGRDMKRLCARLVDYFGRMASCAPEEGEPIPNFFSSRTGPMFTKSASFHGVFLRAPVRGGGPAYFGVYRDALGTIRDWLADGVLKPPAVTGVGPLNAENIGRAHMLLEEGHVQGKLVLTVE